MVPRVAFVLLLLASAAAGGACGPAQTPNGCTEQARIYLDNASPWACADQSLSLSGDLSTSITRAGSGEGCHRTGNQFEDFIVPLAFMYWGRPARVTVLIHGYGGPGAYAQLSVSMGIQNGYGILHGIGGSATVNADEASGAIDVPLRLVRMVKDGKTFMGEQRWRQVVTNTRLQGAWTCPPAPACPGTESYHPVGTPACLEQSLLVDGTPVSRAAVLAPCRAPGGGTFTAGLVYGPTAYTEELTIRIPDYHGPGAYAPWDVVLSWPSGFRQAGQVIGQRGNVVINRGGTSGYLTSNYGVTGPAETGVEFEPFPGDGYSRSISGTFRCA